MSYCIRPRQDFSISTFSKIMKPLYESNINASFILVIDPDTGRSESWICIEDSTTYEEAVNMICSNTDCIPDNFKLKKVKE